MGTSGEPINSTFARIFYPTDEQQMNEHERWPLWAFEERYVSGFFTFLKGMVSQWPSWLPREDFLFYDTLHHLLNLVPQFGFQKVFLQLFGDIYVPIIHNATLKLNHVKKWPIIILSHGLGQSRFVYSQICSDLASMGFIVAAVEHREGSACASRYVETGNNSECVSWIPHTTFEKENEYSARNKQVHFRSLEVSKALDLLMAMDEGIPIDNVFASEDVACIDQTKQYPNLLRFKNTMNVEKPFVLGHSFGGSTALLVLEQDERFKASVAIDAWMFPIKDEHFIKSNNKSVMFINTESFINSKNIEEMTVKFVNNGNKIGYIIKGSVHQNHLDYAYLFRQSALKRFLGLHSHTCPEVVTQLNNDLVIDFLNDQFPTKNGRIDELLTSSKLLIKDTRLTTNA